MTDRTLSMMEVSPELIKIKREYYERLKRLYAGMQNASPGAYTGMGYGYLQAEWQRQSFLDGLIGGLGGTGAGYGPGI